MPVLQDLTQEKEVTCMQLILHIITPYSKNFHILGTCTLKMMLA